VFLIAPEKDMAYEKISEIRAPNVTRQGTSLNIAEDEPDEGG